MASAFRADRLAAEWAVLDLLNYVVVAVAVIKRAHDLKVCLPAAWAGVFGDHVVAGVALVPSLFQWYFLEFSVFF